MKHNARTRLLVNTLSPSVHLTMMQSTDMDDDSQGSTTSTQEELTIINQPKRSLRDRLSECLRCIKKNNIAQQDRIITFNDNGSRSISPPDEIFPVNEVNNQKYSLFSLIPMFLFDQFKQFGNAYFLCVALTQLPIPGSPFECMWVGVWWTHIIPLVFVLCVSLIREANDQYSRYKQDKEINDQLYTKIILNERITKQIKSSNICVGDLIILSENERVPCDMILLWCSNNNGTTFIRTDQLDGETDWKLRKPIQYIQSQNTPLIESKLFNICGSSIKVESPHQNIYEFLGTFESSIAEGISEGLNLENTLWSSTIIASGQVIGIAIYTGSETRAALNTNEAKYKIGRLDDELNYFSKIMFVGLILLSLLLSFGGGLHAVWYIFFGRFVILLSAIIPISLRVHLDFAKLYFSYNIQSDSEIPGTIMRCKTIPEELGRIHYLFSDKTGTLTQNKMVFKKLQLQPPLLYEKENLDLLKKNVKYGFSCYGQRHSLSNNNSSNNNEFGEAKSTKNFSSAVSIWSDLSGGDNKKLSSYSSYKRVSAISQIIDIMEGLALCHNVTPIIDPINGNIEYQASSPDEIALVKFAEQCGVTLYCRNDSEIQLKIEIDNNEFVYFKYEILNIFPFTSETKRMGIILCNKQCDDEILFLSKGADSIMKLKLDESNKNNEWMDEEVENLSREGLRTLVFTKKMLTKEEYNEFKQRYDLASILMTSNRQKLMESIRERLEQDMKLIGISGVEDKLQSDVQNTLELFRNAHIKVWMLTGDKVETAKVIARSSKLVSYGQEFFPLIVKNTREAMHRLDLLGGIYNKSNNGNNIAIIIDGKSLEIYLRFCEKEFIENIIESSVVICCRCTPTQKAEMVKLIQFYFPTKICAAIGDGGNDVAMIQQANIGIGILGKEGQQASLASDVSINQFQYLSRLLLWHGRISYKNTAKMAQFIIHRGTIIALIQSLFSCIFYFSAVPLFTGIIAIGYVCVYTVAPVSSLVLDLDIKYVETVMLYPELYHNLQNGESLNNKTMLLWLMRSVFQSGIIMLFSMILFNGVFHNILTISFTALIITELFNIMSEIKHWHWLMYNSLLISFVAYFISIFIPHPIITNYFDIIFITSTDFWCKSLLTGAVSVAPMAIMKIISKKINPAAYAKLKDNFKRNNNNNNNNNNNKIY